MRRRIVRRSTSGLVAAGALALGLVGTAQPGYADTEGWPPLPAVDPFPDPVSTNLIWDAMSKECRAGFGKWQDDNFQARSYNVWDHAGTYVENTPGLGPVDYVHACAAFNVPPCPQPVGPRWLASTRDGTTTSTRRPVLSATGGRQTRPETIRLAVRQPSQRPGSSVRPRMLGPRGRRLRAQAVRPGVGARRGRLLDPLPSVPGGRGCRLLGAGADLGVWSRAG
jgi:hypothetical protein